MHLVLMKLVIDITAKVTDSQCDDDLIWELPVQ